MPRAHESVGGGAAAHGSHTAHIEPSFESWRDAARALLIAEVPPARVTWRATDDVQLDALASPALASPAPEVDARVDDVARMPLVAGSVDSGAILNAGGAPRAAGDAPHLDAPHLDAPRLAVPRRFLEVARNAACHADLARWALLYRALWRLTHGEPRLMDVAVDDDVHRLLSMDKAVRRDVHKLHAFVRFRRVASVPTQPVDDGNDTAVPEQFVAWFAPTHDCLALAAPFFARRFPNMRWSILGPRRSAHWDMQSLVLGPGVPRDTAPAGDALEALWRTYYASIFNPARTRPRAMLGEMPKKYWHLLPEASIVSDLIADAPARVRRMIEAEARPPRPRGRPR